MGLKLIYNEHKTALRPLFAQISQVQLVHHYLIVAAISQSGLTLNSDKFFGKSEMKFCGIIISPGKTKPVPEKAKRKKKN